MPYMKFSQAVHALIVGAGGGPQTEKQLVGEAKDAGAACAKKPPCVLASRLELLLPVNHDGIREGGMRRCKMTADTPGSAVGRVRTRSQLLLLLCLSWAPRDA